MASRPLSALLRLENPDAIPETGLTSDRLEVNLTSDHKMRTAWRGEIVIPGDGPWLQGEERLVELQIEAKPFEDYVASWRPTLFVCRNDEIIGQLELADLPVRREA
jgi:hypothetical protein